jgi:hypothetical protein
MSRFAVSKVWLMASVRKARTRAKRIVAELEGYDLTGEGADLLRLAQDTLKRLEGLQ